jgi:hypothetical protein
VVKDGAHDGKVLEAVTQAVEAFRDPHSGMAREIPSAGVDHGNEQSLANVQSEVIIVLRGFAKGSRSNLVAGAGWLAVSAFEKAAQSSAQ